MAIVPAVLIPFRQDQHGHRCPQEISKSGGGGDAPATMAIIAGSVMQLCLRGLVTAGASGG